MARATPRVEGIVLVNPADATQAIGVGTPAWYAWLEWATSFALVGASGHSTARKERRRQSDGYWKAYRKRAGVLHSVYLGRSSDLTFDRLSAVATTLATPGIALPARPDESGDMPTISGAPPSITPALVAKNDAQPPMAALPLVLTKLYPPSACPGLVTRPRLVAQVQAGLMGKLLLITLARIEPGCTDLTSKRNSSESTCHSKGTQPMPQDMTRAEWRRIHDRAAPAYRRGAWVRETVFGVGRLRRQLFAQAK